MTLPMWQAAAVVRWLEGRVENLPKPFEETPAKAALTYGDCVAQEILLTALREYYPWIGVEAEESTPGRRAFATNESDHRVVIDPIDGTLRYLKRDGLYAILVGLEHEGRCIASLVALPQADVVIRSAEGFEAEIAYAGGPFQSASCNGRGDRVLVSADVPENAVDRLRAEGYEVALAAGGAVGVSPLLLGTLGGIRRTNAPEGLSRRNWVSTRPTLDTGGVVEAFEGRFPRTHTAGLSGMIVAGSPETLASLRALIEECLR